MRQAHAFILPMRDAFLLDPTVVFLNHGSYGACPREVFVAYQQWQIELERNPVEFLGRRSAALLAVARADLGSAIGAAADDLVFLPNATTGVNIVAQTMAQSSALQPGDEVLAPNHEYGACEAAWQAACATRGASYRQVEIPLPFQAGAFADRLLSQVTHSTRVLYLSHISSSTALVFPVAEVCRRAREMGLLTVIDGAHAPGQLALDLNALDADYYVGNAHKWMCAPKGAAFLHARREHHHSIVPGAVSWGTVAADGLDSPFDGYTGRAPLERRLQWQGTRDIAAFLAVSAAIDFQRRNQWPQHQQRCHAMACDTRRRVARRNGLAAIARDEDTAQMVPIPVHCTDPHALRRHLLDAYRIEVPITQHAGQTFVRLSVQAYTTQAELDLLVQALEAAAV